MSLTAKGRAGVAVGGCVFAFGCAGPHAPQPSTAPTTVPVAKVTAPSAPSPGAAKPAAATHGASEALTKHWVFESPKLALYADLDGLFKTKAIGAFVKILVAMVGQELTPQRTCVEGFAAGAKELAVGGGEEGLLIVTRFDPAAVAPMARCVEAFGDAKPFTIAGARAAWKLGRDGVIAIAPDGIVVSGTKRAVVSALGASPAGDTSLAKLRLGEGEYLAFAFEKADDAIAARGTLLATDERFRLGGHVDLPNAEMARQLAKELGSENLGKRLPQSGLVPPGMDDLARLLSAFHFDADGKRALVSFELIGTPAEQARDLGNLASIGVFSVRRYISNAKQAEAKNTLGQLAKDLVTSWEREDAAPIGKKKLVSYPAVPKVVPKGTKVQTSPADWKPYYPLKFEMGPPQYYQYEIKAAKDGESAEIIARGDLNGDGKTSLFKLAVKVRRSDNVLVVSPSIEELNPDE